MVTVAIPILDDDIAEDEEQFQVTLLSPSNAILTPSRSQAYITINSRDDCKYQLGIDPRSSHMLLPNEEL